MRLRALAPGKVNLCLFLGGTRADGRHQLVTLLESISLADQLELTADPDVRCDEVVCPGVEGPNLVAQALAELRARGWQAPPVRIEIAKRVPVAAGLGGGSADAAAGLRLARRVAPFPDGVRAPDLAARLGADVPSQLDPGLALGTGAGEIVRSVAPIAPHAFVVLPSPARLSTADVYREADRLGLARSADRLRERSAALDAALAPGAELQAELLVNDLEPAARSLCPQIDSALDALRGAGADHALVCGSGPTVAGLYWGHGAADEATAIADALADRWAGATAAFPVDGAFGEPAVAAVGHNSV
jgi:4-diphosphocytidyl-2-C-methyl-D-erythritol kinase